MTRPLSEIFERAFSVAALVMLCSTFLPLGRFFGVEADNPSASDPANRLSMGAVLLFSTVALFTHYRRMLPALASAWLPLLIVGLAFASVAWSAVPDIVMRRSLNLLGTTLFGIYLAARWRPGEVARLLVAAGCVMALSSIAVTLVSPGNAIMEGGNVNGALRGAFSHKNMLGWVSGLVIIACVWVIESGRRTRLAIVTLLLTVPLWLAARSLTGMGATVITGLACVAMLGMRLGTVTRLLWGYLVIVAGTVALSILATGGAFFLRLVGRSADLTGRGPLWEQLERAIAERPLLGYGFQSFWQPESGWHDRIAASVGWVVPTAHNGWIDIWLSLGLLGLLPVALLIGRNLWRASIVAVEGRLPGGGLIFALNAYFLVVSFSESNLVTPGMVSWAIHVASAVWLARHLRVRARTAARRAAFVWRIAPRPSPQDQRPTVA
jgi:exopolysaccharide production protein ExoQ